MNDYLTKPFTSGQLGETLRRYLRAGRTPPEAAGPAPAVGVPAASDDQPLRILNGEWLAHLPRKWDRTGPRP